MTEPEIDLESTGSDADLLGFEADGPVDILEDAKESTDGDSGETTEEESKEQLAEGTESEEPAAEDVAEGEPEGDVAADQEEVTPSGYTFLGREYETQEAAEHAIKSQMGSVSALQTQIDQAHQERDQLKALYDDATQQVDTPESESAEAKGDGAPPTDSKAFKKISDVLNPNVLEEMTEKLGQAETYRYMLSELDKVQEHNLGMVNSERLGVIEAEHEETQEFNAIVDVFSKFAANTVDGTPGGEAKYPEMREDEAFIGRVTDRYLKTPTLRDEGEYGVYLAYLAEKDWEAYKTEADAPPVENAPKPSEIINGELKPEPEKDQTLISGPGPSLMGGPPETESSRIRQELTDGARGFQDDTLGYDV